MSRLFVFVAACGLAVFSLVVWRPPLGMSRATTSATITVKDDAREYFSANQRQVRAVFGPAADAMVRSIEDLKSAHPDPSIQNELVYLEKTIGEAARRILEIASPKLNLEAILEELTKPEPPSITLLSATYGPPVPVEGRIAPRADVKWILDPLIFYSVLRLPKDLDLRPLFGSIPPGFSDGGANWTLNVEAETDDGRVLSQSVAAPDGKLSSDLIISNAQPTQNIPMSRENLTLALEAVTKGKKGLEIGGPTTLPFPFFQKIYKEAASTDLINFSEKTLWGVFQDGSTFTYPEGGTGTVHIMDGSTLEYLDDNTYDFAIGSHYLEHLINPLKALASLTRVIKPGGHIILVLPRKEACFDHYRGQSTLDSLLARYLRNTTELELSWSNIDAWTMGNDLTRDGAAGTLDQFRARSLRFEFNKAIHTDIYDFDLLQAVANIFDLEVVTKGLPLPLHQFVIMKKAQTSGTLRTATNAR